MFIIRIFLFIPIFGLCQGDLTLVPYPNIIQIPESGATAGASVWKFVVKNDATNPFTTCALIGANSAEFTATVDADIGCDVTFNDAKNFEDGDTNFEFGVQINTANPLDNGPVEASKVLVTITNVDDDAPCFDNAALAVSISENTKAGSIIVKTSDVPFTDADTESTYIEFNLADNGFEDFFLPSKNLPQIASRRQFDFETNADRSIIIDLEARDQNRNTAAGCNNPIKITVTVTNENDNPVHCNPKVFYTTINDNAAARKLGDIFCTDQDEDSFDPSCTLVDADTSLFEVVNSHSGTANQGNCELNTKTVITLAQADEFSQFNFYIEVKDTLLNTVQHTSTIVVVIMVNPASNGALTLTPATYTPSLEEDLEVGYRIDTQEVLSYSDASHDEYPHIWGASGTGIDNWGIDPIQGYLYLRYPFDFEDIPQFVLTVSVIRNDGTGPARPTAQATLTINVLNANDEIPTFTSAAYASKDLSTTTNTNPTLPESVTLAEGDAPTTLHTFSVNDADATETIQVYIDGILPNELNSPFVVNCPTTCGTSGTWTLGLIRKADLDSDEGGRLLSNHYVVTIAATDGKYITRSFVDVKITPANDNTPVISANPTQVKISEATQSGTLLSSFVATDNDDVILQKDFSAASVRYTLGTVTATGITLDSSFFAVDFLTGQLTLVKSIDVDDADSGRTIQVEIGARDNYGAGNAATPVTVTIVVEDVNDNAPTCAGVNQFTFVALDEDQSTPHNLLNLSGCVDKDFNDQQAWGTEIFSGGSGDDSGNQYFGIVSNTLRLVTGLDYDFGQTLFEIVVRLFETDEGPKAEHDLYFTVIVTVAPKQDGIPDWTISMYDASLREDAPFGTALQITPAAFSYTDPDGFDPENPHAYGSMAISICQCDSTAISPCPITLNEEAEELYVIGDLTSYSQCTITLELTDRAGGQSSPDATLNIALSKDDVPVCDPKTLKVEITETQAPSQTLVADLNCADADGDTLTFVMDPGHPFFEAGGGTGELRTSAAAAFDFATQSSYLLGITASDSDGNSDFVEILVIVTSVNDGTISCTPFPAGALEISEAIEVNTKLGELSCEDEDGDDTANGQLTYSLTGSQDNLVIDPVSGAYYLAKAIDFEDTALTNPITVSFVVTDNSGDSITVTRSIQYTNINDNKPTCSVSYDTTNAVNGEIEEGTVANTRIATLTCEDVDSTATFAQEISLVFTGDTDRSLFKFDPTSCSLGATSTCTAELQLAKTNDADIDGSQFQNVEFFVSDSKFSTTYNIPFVTTSVNEFTPTFVNLPATVEIEENTPIVAGSSIFRVIASDDDSDTSADGQVYFELDSSNGFFDINTETGEVYQIAELDYEEPRLSVQVDIVVKDRSGGRPSYPTAALTVNILNVNDKAPIWTPGSVWAYTMDENTATSTLLATLSADAVDDNAADIRYYITAQIPPTPTYFSLPDPTDGMIETTSNALDYETTDSVILEVKACDSQGVIGCLSVTGLVYVTVTDVNEYAPAFAQSEYQFDVIENTDIGFQVGKLDIQTDAVNQDKIADDTKCSLQTNSYFAIDPNTCVITLVAAIDRETETTFSLVATATDTSLTTQTATVTVDINVLDVNDHTPVCTGLNNPYNINENLSGTLVEDSTSTDICITCTDGDATAEFNLDSTVYKITSINGDSGDTSFALDFTQVACQFGVKMDRALSFEDGIDEFIVEVTATDMSDESEDALSSVILVTIVLNDVNEDDPVFVNPSSGSVTVTILETMPRGATVYVVEAVQLLDTLTPVTYEISSTSPFIRGFDSSDTPTNQPNAFEISSNTGEILANTEFDHARFVKYVMEVIVTDTQGTFGSRVTATITVLISDMNNHPPVFATNYAEQAAENSPQGTVVGTIEASDNDEPPNSDLSFYIESGNQDDMFGLQSNGNPNQQEVIFAQSTSDCEAKSDYELIIIAIDGAAVGLRLSATTTFHVELTGTNEFFPQWDASSDTSATVNEGSATSGTVVATVLATDDDSCDTHGDVIYEIASQTSSPAGFNNLFAVDKVSGEVTLTQEVDREAVESSELVIRACDMNGATSADKKCSSATLVISVNDLDDNNPLCSAASASATISEDIPVSSTLLILADMCSDMDATEQFGTLTYSLSPAISPFAIEASTGRIYVDTAGLDFETTTSYSTEAIVSDGSGPDTTVAITIFITGANEFSPAQDPSGALTPASPANVAESTATGSMIAQLNFVDDDDGMDGEILCTLYNGTEFFEVDPFTCEIFLIKELDFETSPICYNILAKIYDRPSDPDVVKHFDYSFQLCKTDDNDNTPICDPPSYVAFMDDEIQANTIITSLSCTDADSAANDNNAIYYEVVSQNPVPTGFNFLARTAGTASAGPDIFVSAIVDLDTNPVVFYELDVRVVDQSNTGVNRRTIEPDVKVFIHVRDVNNFDPVITAPPNPSIVNFAEKECCSSITLIQTLTVTDSDYIHDEANVPFTASIVSGNSEEVFQLFSDTNWNEFELHVVKTVDKEQTDTYILEIEVFDEPDYLGTQKTATLTLTVSITDLNDNAIACDPSEVTISIPEASTGVTDLYLPCTDVDDTGVMVASLTAGSMPANYATYFDFTTGPGSHTLRLNRKTAIPYNNGGTPGNVFNLVAEVTDSVHSTQEVTIHVNVELVDNGNGVLTCTDVNIGEEVAVGTLVNDIAAGFFNATADPDYPADTYYYSFSAGNTGGYFSIERLTGQIRVARKLDRETVSSVGVTVQVNDGSSDVTCNFDIIIDDYNDNVPIFDPQTYSVNLNEYSPRDTTVATLTITDADQSNLPAGQVILADLTMVAIYGNVTLFKLTDCGTPVQNQFCIETEHTIDTDHFEYHRLKITSMDNNGGTPVLEGFALVMVNIVPQNANAPTIVNSGATNVFEYPESLFVGSLLSTVTLRSTDADSSKTWFGRPVYSLDYSRDSNPGRAEETFSIDRYSGEIYLTCKLNFVQQNQFLLTLNVVDDFSGGLTDSYDFQINVLDVNDHAPEFSSKTYFGNIDDGATNPDTVTMTTAISATDGDVDASFNVITYTIDTAKCNTGSLCNDFLIDSTTGVLTVNTPATIDFDLRKMTYVIPITASDPQGLTDSALVYITVNDLNDNMPYLDPNPSYISIYEQMMINSVIAVLTAADDDSMSTNGGYRFVQQTHTDLFSTDSTTGVVRVLQTLDRESANTNIKQSQYEVLVEVRDQGSNPGALTATSTLIVEVMDINDNDPAMQQATYTASISECEPPYSTVVTIAATDADFEINSQLNYSFTSQNDFFHLDPISGTITSLQTLDREAYPTGFAYNVITWDQGEVPKSGTATVQITIDDCNDEIPQFDKTMYTWNVAEDVQINTLFTTSLDKLLATDGDEPLTPNSEIKYALDAFTSTFGMFTEDDGNIRTVAFLDRENIPVYSFDCLARDQGTPQLTGTVPCVIYVTDVNDEVPTYDSSNYVIQINENLPIGDVVRVLTATDNDEEGNVNKEIRYSISSNSTDGQLYFQYISTSGAISVRREIDYETTTEIIFEVLATDQGTPALTGSASITVQVQDLNDNYPVYVPDNFYHGVIIPNYKAYKSCIEVVQATDADSGQNGILVYSFKNLEYKFEIGPDSGCVDLRPDQTVRADDKYSMRVIAQDNGNPSLSTEGVVRVDVISPSLSVIKVAVDMSFSLFDEEKQREFADSFQTVCQRTNANCKMGVLYTERRSSTNNRQRRKRRTVNSGLSVWAYLYAYDSSLDLSNTEAEANFLTSEEMLRIFQLDGDGSPILALQDEELFGDFPILSVDGYPKEEQSFWDQAENRWLVGLCAGVFILIIAVICFYLVVRYKTLAGVSVVRTRDARGPGVKNQPKRAAPQKVERRRDSKIAVAPTVQNKEQFDKSKAQLQQKSKPLVVAPAPVQKPVKPASPKPLLAEEDVPDTQKTLEVKAKSSSVPSSAADLSRFNGMAQDPATGRYYAYNSQTNERAWLRSRQVEAMKARLNLK